MKSWNDDLVAWFFYLVNVPILRDKQKNLSFHSPKNGRFSETLHVVFAINELCQKGSILQRCDNDHYRERLEVLRQYWRSCFFHTQQPRR